MSDSPEKSLVWPPKKEDLERLYHDERLSAAKIAKAYGLGYADPKTAESTVLYQLKKNGIVRRDRTDHLRKFPPEIIDGWVRRYEAGESLKQIAGHDVSSVTIWNHLKRRGILLRDKVEAQIEAVTQHTRRPFEGDKIEKAYLMGLRYGDLHVVRHGRAIRVRVSTTHPAMANLFESLFSSYGHVSRYPRKAKLVGFEWTLECDLHESFGFLIHKISIFELENLDNSQFLAFFAGLFDAEGSVHLHKKGKRYDPELIITNSDKNLIDCLFGRMQQLGFSPYADWRRQRHDRSGINGESLIGRVELWRVKEVQEFLRRIQLRHAEKIAKTKLVQVLEFRSSSEVRLRVLLAWNQLRVSIHHERAQFLQAAEDALKERGRLECTDQGITNGQK